MPVFIRKVRNMPCWEVKDVEGRVHAKCTSLANAKAQVRILDQLHGGALSSREVNKFVKASYKKKSHAHNVDGYTLDTSLSSKKNKVYVNPEGKVVVANAGTSSLSDWKNNPSIAFGSYKKTDRYKQAEKTQKKAIEKYGLSNITNVGHSQSGETERIFAKKGLTKNGIALNPAIIGKKSGHNVDTVRSSGDLVSALTMGKKKTIKAKTYSPLAEHSASILSRHPHKMYGKGFGRPHTYALPNALLPFTDIPLQTRFY